jgi:phosphoribosylaminoimidazole-succinocarboxamide synthase
MASADLRTSQPAIPAALPSATAPSIVTETDLCGILPLVARGKVRDVYQVDEETLLFVATDRISAYDVVMQNVRTFSSAELLAALGTLPRASSLPRAILFPSSTMTSHLLTMIPTRESLTKASS